MKRWFFGAQHLGSYMLRWLVRTPWGTLRVHHIQESDAGRDFHDHPWNFTSLILKGGYIEHRPGCFCQQVLGKTVAIPGWGPCKSYLAPAVVRRRATDLHRLELLDGPATTLVLSSAYVRSWGFLTPSGWVGYREYHRSFYDREDLTASPVRLNVRESGQSEESN